MKMQDEQGNGLEMAIVWVLAVMLVLGIIGVLVSAG